VIEKFLARLTINAVIVALLVGALIAQTIRIEGFKFWPISHNGLKAQVSDLKDKLREISSTHDEQRQVTKDNIVETRIIYRDANRVAERIEKAPTAPDCKTPDAILSADL
jgi:hypothetical protein